MIIISRRFIAILCGSGDLWPRFRAKKKKTRKAIDYKYLNIIYYYNPRVLRSMRVVFPPAVIRRRNTREPHFVPHFAAKMFVCMYRGAAVHRCPPLRPHEYRAVRTPRGLLQLFRNDWAKSLGDWVSNSKPKIIKSLISKISKSTVPEKFDLQNRRNQ